MLGAEVEFAVSVELTSVVFVSVSFVGDTVEFVVSVVLTSVVFVSVSFVRAN